MKRKIRRTSTKVRYKYRRKKSKPQSFMSKAMRYVLPVAYGYGRDKISDFIMNSEIGKQIPATNFTDEAVMLGAGYAAKLLGLTRNATIRQLVSHSRTIELNNIGQTWSNLGQMSNSQSVGQSSVANTYVYQ